MLSLQTLLSFSDQLSDAEHQEMIAKRIAVDKYASQLLLRLDSVKKSVQLEAPDVFDPDVIPNPNLVAEYLDHQLQNPDQIHEYENACLDSDSLLAEIGCCYDVLNHRLPIPINPPKNCRHRLYYIPIQDAITDSNTDSAKSTYPADSVCAADSNNFVNSANPIDSAKSTNSTNSTESANSDNPIDSVNAAQTVHPTQSNHFSDLINFDHSAITGSVDSNKLVDWNRKEKKSNNKTLNALETKDEFALSKEKRESKTNLPDTHSNSNDPDSKKMYSKRNHSTLTNSTRELDLKPKFSCGRFIFKQLLAASVVLAGVYFWSNGPHLNVEEFWQEESSQISKEDELESEIIGQSETNVIRPNIISTSNIKNMPVITVDELKQIQKNPQSALNKSPTSNKSNSSDSSNDEIIIFDDSESTVSNQSPQTPEISVRSETDSSLLMTTNPHLEPENIKF